MVANSLSDRVQYRNGSEYEELELIKTEINQHDIHGKKIEEFYLEFLPLIVEQPMLNFSVAGHKIVLKPLR